MPEDWPQLTPLIPRRFHRLANRVALLLTGLALAGVVLHMLALPLLAWRWVRLPFMGAFVEQTLVFNSVGSRTGARWSGIEAGLHFPQQLVAVEDRAAGNAAGLRAALAARRVGETVTLQVRDGSGPTRPIAIVLQTFPPGDLVAYFVVPYLIGLAYLAIGAWVFRLRRDQAAGRAFALFCASTAVVVAGLFDLYTTHAFSWLWTLALPAAAGSLLTLGLVFPQESAFVARYPALRWLGFVPAGLLAIAAERSLYDLQDPTAYALGWRNEFAFAAVAIVVFLGMTLRRRLRAPLPIAREQARVILWGSALAFGPLLYFLSLSSAGAHVIFDVWLYFVPMVSFPLAVGYAILRYRLLDMERLLGRAILYLLLAAITVIAYALILGGLSLLASEVAHADSPIVIALLVLALALALNPLREWLGGRVDNLFLRGSRAYRQRLQQLGRELATAADLQQVLQTLESHLQHVVRPTHTRVFLRETRPAGAHNQPPDFVEYPPRGTGDPLRFPAQGDVARALTLSNGGGPQYLPSDLPVPTRLAGDRERLLRLRANLLIPFPGPSGLVGWLAMGPRQSGEPYNREDLRFLESLGDQAALAIERAGLFHAEREQRELAEALRAVGVHLSATLDSDAILDRLLEHIARVVPYDTAVVMLVDPAGERTRPARMRGYHSLPPEIGRAASSLELEIQAFPSLRTMVETGQPLVISDPQHDPRWIPLDHTQYVRSWAGAPIVIQGKVAAFFSLNKTEAGFYRPEHARRLSAFAGQAALALQNARLYEQAQNRAARLSTLNEIGRAVTRMLALDDVLEVIYQQVRRSLPLDAFFVALYDPAADRLSYPLVYDDNQRFTEAASRLSETTGLGRAISKGAPLLVNRDPQELARLQRPAHPVGRSDRVSASLMFAPLQVSDRVIGAISAQSYAHHAYGADELSLLSGVAHQAAVAIENARLFDATRRQLNELSVLHAVASACAGAATADQLIERATQIIGETLYPDHFGLLLVDEQAGVLRAHASYRGVAREAGGFTIPLGQGVTGRVAVSGQPVLLPDVREAAEYLAYPQVNPYMRSELCVPLRVGERVIAVINAESAKPGAFTRTDEQLLSTFAGQLATALERRRLFTDLERSNAELALAYDATLEGWSRALELRDEETEGHTRRVTDLTVRLVRALGLPEAEVEHVRRGALLHDIGKMGIPDAILLKPGALSDEEWEIMRQHPTYAYEMLLPIVFLRPALDIPYCHHERWDGTGYPRQLKQDEIPLCARAFAVVDVWDALRSNRPYRGAWEAERVRAYLHAHAGTHFDSAVVEMFLTIC